MDELKLKETQFSMTEMVENLHVVLSQMARGRKVELEMTCEAEHVNLMGDVVRLRQVLMNMVSNSIKYTEAFGRVRAAVKECSDDEDYAVFDIVVEDTGVGMTEEFIQNQMFQPFERARTSMYRRLRAAVLV